MGSNSALSWLEEQEQRLRLWDREPNGFPIWYARRLGAYRRQLTQSSASMPKAPQSKLQRWRQDARRLGVSLAELSQAFRSSALDDKVLLLSSSSYRRRQKAGAAPCIFAVHLEEQLGDQLRVLELDTGNIPHSERPSNVTSVDLAFGPSYRFTRAMARMEQKLVPALAKDALPFMEVGERGILARSLHARIVYQAALQWFQRQRPRAVFVLCAYSHFTPIQLAAKRLAIPVIELQHGVIHESHPGYIFPDLGDERFRALPVPDHLVAFGDYFGRLLERHSVYWRGRWSVGGHPWLTRTLCSVPEIEAPQICFFSQCEAPVRERILTCAVELGALLPEVTIGTKPHPGEQDAGVYYQRAIDQGVRLYDRGADSYALLKRTELAVCVHSTVVIEALAFDCTPVAIQSDAWTEAIRVLVEGGHIQRATSGRDLCALWRRRAGSSSARALEMFAVGVPEPDFEQLIARVQERVKKACL
jgi:hypothetical protein